MRNKNISGICRGLRPRGWIALLAAMSGAGVHAQALEGDLPAIYGPIGTPESATASLSNGETAQSTTDCYSTFTAPMGFSWTGGPAVARSSISGCTFTATSDAPWLQITSTAGQPYVVYQVAQNTDASPRAAHLSINNDIDGSRFTLTITQYGSGAALHSRDYDYLSDGEDDLVVWRPGNGTWYVAATAKSPAVERQWGLPGDIPVLGDYDGDGHADFTVWRPSNGGWYTVPSTRPDRPVVRQWGLSGDIPVPGDYDGDGKTDFAVFRPSNQTWYVIDSLTGAQTAQSFGLSGDVPMPADYDGDGKVDIGVWRPSNGTWYFLGSRDGTLHTQQMGLPGDIPVPTTYLSAGFFCVWRPTTGNWYLASTGEPTEGPYQLGLSGDIPMFLRNGAVVWRPSTGAWYIGSPSPFAAWGLSGDVIPGAPQMKYLAR